jgi:hypothetical protein
MKLLHELCSGASVPSVAYRLGAVVVATKLPELDPDQFEVHDEPLTLIMRVGEKSLHAAAGAYNPTDRTFSGKDVWVRHDSAAQYRPVETWGELYPQAVLL